MGALAQKDLDFLDAIETPPPEIPIAQSPRPEPILRPVMPELDTIRGLAILGVLFYHEFYNRAAIVALPHWQQTLALFAWPGRLGVNLFFVLSGFLITGILLEARGEKSYYKRFYIRRALRILPAYTAVLLILAAVGYPTSFVLLSLVYLTNFVNLFGVPFAYLILWSLAVEEHFYMVWPLVVRKLSMVNLERVVIGIIVLSPLARLISFRHSTPNDLNWMFYTWNNADGLACGALLALFVRRTHGDRRRLYRACLIATSLAAALWAIGWRFGIMFRDRSLGAALQVTPFQFLFFAVVGIFLLVGTTRWKWLVLWRPLRFLGYISYGLYLIHELVFNAFDRLQNHAHLFEPGYGAFTVLMARFFCATSAAILLAWLSRKYFENLFLRMKPKT
ncbi:MAG: acyltransferase [Candidatus Acidiferrales bacterium]